MGRTTRCVRALVGAVALAGALVAPGISSATQRPSGSMSLAQAHLTSTCGVRASATLRIIMQPEPCTLVVTLSSSFTIDLDPGFRWATPHSSSTSLKVTRVTRSSAQRVSATVTARALGRATLTSEGAIICPAGQACPALARLWVVKVVVVRSLSSTRVVTVTQLDSGRRVTLRVGDRLSVHLSGPSNYTWTSPTSSNAEVLRVVAGSRGSVASATFVAVSPGTVRATSLDNPKCYPQCLAPSRLFSLDVTVTR